MCSWVNHTFMYFPRPEHIAHQLDPQIRVQIPAATHVEESRSGKAPTQRSPNMVTIPPLCSGYDSDWDVYILQIYTYNNPRNKTKDPPTAPKNNFCPWTGGGRDTTPKPTIDIQHFKKPNLSDHTSQTIFAPQMRTDFWTTRIVMSFLGGIPKKKTQPPLPGEVGGCHRYFFQNFGF